MAQHSGPAEGATEPDNEAAGERAGGPRWEGRSFAKLFRLSVSSLAHPPTRVCDYVYSV